MQYGVDGVRWSRVGWRMVRWLEQGGVGWVEQGGVGVTG